MKLLGLSRLTWLKKLTDSMRNSPSTRSVNLNFLKSEASVRQYPGPRSALRFWLPKVPTAGTPKTLRSVKKRIDPSLARVVPVLTSPLTFGRQVPGSEMPPVSKQLSNGRPLWIVVFEVNCQPPDR